MIRLNLLPDVKLEYLRTKRTQAKVITISTIVTIAVAAFVVLMALWVFGGQTIQKVYLTDQIKKNSAKLEAVPDIEKYLTIQNQLDNITKLHEGKNDFSRLMSYLLVLNPSPPHNVTLTNVEIASDEATKTMILNGEVKDYTGLATFRDTLLNAQLNYLVPKEGGKEGETDKVTERLFETVTVASSSLEAAAGGTPVVTFKIETSYNPNAFLNSINFASVSVPIKTTTQSAQSSPNVFGESSVQKEQ